MVALFAVSVLSQQTRFDILITNARIVDGAGNPSYFGSIGVKGDTIVAVGHMPGATGEMTIDAKGMVAAPGFIDIHSHGRGGIFEVPTAENYLREGVTTFIEGPDGSSPIPLAPFLERLTRTPRTVNVGMMVGHGSIRQEVIGLVNRKATPAEMERMRGIAKQAMLDGAFGLSTGLFYVPANYAPTEEVIELAKVVGPMGGIHISHMRDEAASILEGVRETIRIGEEGGLPTQVTHHKVIGKDYWGKSRDTLRLVEEARARGVDVTIDQYPYTASSTGLAALLPQWSQEGGTEGFQERLNAPVQRGKIKAEVVNRLRNDRGAGDAKNVVIASCGFDASLAGKSLADLTRARGVEVSLENAAETAMEILKKGNCSAIYHAISEDDVIRIMQSPYTMIASDGGISVMGAGVPHPRNYGTFARVLGLYVREKKVISLEEAVRKMSGYPAQRLKIWDRGLLRPGMKADVVIFDAATVADQATFEKPHQYSVGFRDVIVNGKIVLKDGGVTAARPGVVLYGPGR